MFLTFDTDDRYDSTTKGVDKVEECMASCNELNCFAFYYAKMEEGEQDFCIIAYNSKNNWRFKEKDLIRFGDVPGAISFYKAVEGTTYLRVYDDEKDAVQKQLY